MTTSSPSSSSSTTIPNDFPTSLHPLLTRPGSSIPLIPQSAFSPELSTEITSLAQSERWSDGLRAALHLLNDETGKAHDVVTDREDCEACNVVHAVLHRREADYWNSKYWYSRLSHPWILSFYPPPSSSSPQSLSTARSSAKQFVDEVQSLASGSGRGKGGTASSACGAKNLLAGVKERQEAELKGLVRYLWEHRGEKSGGI
ncbi:hypothetical protein BCV69DRAFT_285244 [Microstroma glucosiphilum]|uniref:Uncharacterized protein n=1 Tax=Pseudomicrostroma glucosiphilum TaxID=1684307 RepID=A0A316TYZ3_9BASI|nr:hypothetical protein BCV69DRAFT_285244 [Pseudomicrostroma glucosiphilum]PWN18270.1 hypothetical protein BCV69DRAFT_285244 [Pseudomicrostroma glucosiphilum]